MYVHKKHIHKKKTVYNTMLTDCCPKSSYMMSIKRQLYRSNKEANNKEANNKDEIVSSTAGPITKFPEITTPDSILDDRILHNISAITNKDCIFNGWLFPCFKCRHITSNYIICDMKYELYICKQCLSKESSIDKAKLYHNAISYCRKIAKTKIHIV